MHLSVIIPAYNEQEIIAQSIIAYNEYLKKQNYSYEFVVVNDGSSDNTAQAVLALKKTIPNIILIDNPTNRGKGAAIQEGLLRANGAYRLFLDADNSAAISHLDSVWPYFSQGAEIVIGSRDARDAAGALVKTAQKYWKTLLGKSGNFIFRLLAVSDIWDTQCGFKVFSAKFTKHILPKTKVRRWAIDAEILMLARKNNYAIKIIPILWHNSARKSKVSAWGYITALAEVFKIKWNLISGKYD